jgi:hypothetical protein
MTVPVQPIGLIHEPEARIADRGVRGLGVGLGEDEVADAVEGVDPARAGVRSLTLVQGDPVLEETNSRPEQRSLEEELLDAAAEQFVALGRREDRDVGIVLRQDQGHEAEHVLPNVVRDLLLRRLL